MNLLKGFLLSLCLLTTLSAVMADDTPAKPGQDDIDSIAGGGSDEFTYVRYTDEYIQLQIHQQAQVSCKKGLCTLFAVTNNNHYFGVDFTVGYGNNNFNGVGNGVVVVGNDGNGFGNNNNNEPFVSLTARWGIGKCTQKVNVPKSLYISMNTFMYNLINEDGTPRRGFTPADEAMIMFYTTIMKQANGCNNGNGK